MWIALQGGAEGVQDTDKARDEVATFTHLVEKYRTIYNVVLDIQDRFEKIIISFYYHRDRTENILNADYINYFGKGHI